MTYRPQPAPMFVVEGRIGGRWWLWQRFRSRDEAARELAVLASEKRFDGVRMVITILGRNGAPPFTRELVVIDEGGVHAPERQAATPPQQPRATAHAAATRRAPARTPQPAAPQPAAARPQQPAPPAETVEIEPMPQRNEDRDTDPVLEGREPVTIEALPEDAGDTVLAVEDPEPAEQLDREIRDRRRFGRRQVMLSIGAGLASLALAVISYEVTRSLIGLPDLLHEARQTVALFAAGPERPMVAAARQGNAEEVARLLRGGFAANSDDALGTPALLIAARGGHTAAVRKLLEGGADPNRGFGAGDTPLLAAAREGLNASIDLMLAKGGHVNSRGGSDFCSTPLLVAAGGGRLDTVNLLLSKGASFDVLPGCKRGPLDVATAYPRVREALESAYQRRLASVPRPGAAPAVPTPASVVSPPPPPPRPAKVSPSAMPAPPKAAPAPQPASAVKPAPVPEKPVAAGAYSTIMFGMSWRDSLAGVRAKAKSCRDVGRRYVACVLAVRPWLEDIESVEAWFDRADGDRFVSIEARSAAIVDSSVKQDGQAARQRFDQVRQALEQRIPNSQRPIVARQAPVGIPFFEGLKPEVNAGDFSVFWSDEGRRRPATVHLKLTGVNERQGYYRVVVSNPLRTSQQAAIELPKPR